MSSSLKVKNKAAIGRKYELLILSLISGLLFWLGWPTLPFPFLLFFAIAPIFAMEEYISQADYKRSGRTFYGYLYLTLFLWNISTTWWVYNSTVVGALFMLLANAALMSIPFVLFRVTKKSAGDNWGYFSFVLYWITFEYIHLNWDLSWPWLTLGNGFASFPEWVQWYEYTGVFGGTLWILLANIAFYFVFLKGRAIQNRQFRWRSFSLTVLCLIPPIGYSYIRYAYYESQGEEKEVVVLQPNIDPFTEKFIGSENFIPFEQQLETFISLSEQKITPNTHFLVWPETAFDGAYNEEAIEDHKLIQRIKRFKAQYPDLALITGMTTFRLYGSQAEATPTARYSEESGYYDVFNTAFYLDENNNITFYHKSKLVPGVEIMPYPQVLRFVSELLFSLGGSSGGFGRQDERTVLENREGTGIAPAICYESIYGDFMSEYIRNGANAIFIITNDGWWGNTPGHQQHLAYASLRAIELRRSIARSANTGISAFLNQRGDILQATEYWEQDVIRGNIQLSEQLTFYARYGDYIARTAAWLSVFVFLAAVVKRQLLKNT
ncbi:apolipoprotein N-acyltransferase [Catalinimonas niigatensis]|uniref:apolipoprotein N-acyltransferase n=1 Tax=Catalinimonas niigatensis TaxID=1397264 RepID=UPI002666053B|nr:apolipoprotein N-acyltransferase [Catalinimonas niigatensis]WPP48278.1 apolipoprotein N-acyltransferase [Catalinimonas niigatensis]